jgi:hypothetical protein
MHAVRVTLAVAICVVGIAAVGAKASADPGNGNGATVINGLSCFVFLPPVSGTTTDTHTVVTPSGNTVVICHFDIVNPTGMAIVDTGFGCSTLIGTTNDSKFVLSASGEGTLTCHINGG